MRGTGTSQRGQPGCLPDQCPLARSSASPKSAYEPVEDSLIGLRCRSLLAANNGNAAGHSCDERHILRDLVDSDPHRNALRETNPGEYRIDVRQALCAACGVRGTDAARDALDPAPDRSFIAKQYRLDVVSGMDVGELSFLEIRVDPIGIFVD